MTQTDNALRNDESGKISELQNNVADFWNAEPCDSENSLLSPDSQDYYLEIESDRYHHQGHILEVLGWLDWNGKRVLEIGTGVGTDARQLVSRGALYHGINVDSGSCEATSKALAVFGLPCDVRKMSATEITFEPGHFDVVYSFGVLHHIPEAEKAVVNIERALRPGGYLLFMVYNRPSINYQLEIRHLRRLLLHLLALPGLIPLFGALGFPKEKLQRHVELHKRLGKMSDEEWLSRNTDGPDNPYSLVYGRDEVAGLLGGGFRIHRNEVFYFDWRHWGVLGRILPTSLVRWLGNKWGWHRIVLAEKLVAQ